MTRGGVEMGCDIHAFLEHRYDDPLRGWHGWRTLAQDVDINRNYSLFAVLAGVRNRRDPPLIPVAPPRGLPPDVSEWVAIEAEEWREDGHSHSYLTYAELQRAQQLYSDVDIHRTQYIRRHDPVPDGMELLHYEDNAALVQEKQLSKSGPNVDLEAIIAYLGVYERRNYRTRMTFWFDN